MSFVLGAASRSNLEDVHPDLVRVVELAIALTSQDFRVHDGARTLAEQRAFVAAGTSWTMKSKHLIQPDGLGHAVDLVPILNHRLLWDWNACLAIASAMSRAGSQLGVVLRWGGVWDQPMTEYGPSVEAVGTASRAYLTRRRLMRKRAALDGPHFELNT